MRKPLLFSVVLHIAVFIFILLDIPFMFSSPKTVMQPAIIVDISQVKTAPKTNLPPKQVKEKKAIAQPEKKEIKKEAVKETAKKATKEAPKKPTTETKPSKPKPVAAKPKPVAAKPAPVKKADTVIPSREITKKATTKTKPADDDIKSLLASVRKLKETPAPIAAPREIPQDAVTQGIKGGNTKGSYYQELTISEKDALAAKLSQCWNIDAGVKGTYNMDIEVKVALRENASVARVEITDMSRYNQDTAFRSVAESARRAVYICEGKGKDSPFLFLAEKHGDKYNLWQDLILNFNPMDGGVR